MLESEDNELDAQEICLVCFVMASLLDGHTQDVEALHAALRAVLSRCGAGSEQVPWHLISARAMNKQVARAAEAARDVVKPTLQMLAPIEDAKSSALALPKTKKCVKSPLLMYFNFYRERDAILGRLVGKITSAYWAVVKREFRNLDASERLAIEDDTKDALQSCFRAVFCEFPKVLRAQIVRRKLESQDPSDFDDLA